MELTKKEKDELDRKLYKLKLYIEKNPDCKVWISRRGNCIILDCRIKE